MNPLINLQQLKELPYKVKNHDFDFISDILTQHGSPSKAENPSSPSKDIKRKPHKKDQEHEFNDLQVSLDSSRFFNQKHYQMPTKLESDSKITDRSLKTTERIIHVRYFDSRYQP